MTYCLMPNHVQPLLETTTPNLSSGVQWLNGCYARAMNRRHRRSGHLFQGRFGSERIEDDAQLWMTIGYIARNPVEAGLCRTCDEWPWSSHQAIAAQRTEEWLDADRLLAYLGGLGGDPRQRYAECVGAPADYEAAA